MSVHTGELDDGAAARICDGELLLCDSLFVHRPSYCPGALTSLFPPPRVSPQPPARIGRALDSLLTLDCLAAPRGNALPAPAHSLCSDVYAVLRPRIRSYLSNAYPTPLPSRL
jgi:hypothetical protein